MTKINETAFLWGGYRVFCHSICETHDQNNCTRSFVQKSALIPS